MIFENRKTLKMFVLLHKMCYIASIDKITQKLNGNLRIIQNCLNYLILL
jgi:hypothetical protein